MPLWVQTDGKESDGQAEASWGCSENFPLAARRLWINHFPETHTLMHTTHTAETQNPAYRLYTHTTTKTKYTHSSHRQQTLNCLPWNLRQIWNIYLLALPPTQKLPTSFSPMLSERMGICSPLTHAGLYISTATSKGATTDYRQLHSIKHANCVFYAGVYCIKGDWCQWAALHAWSLVRGTQIVMFFEMLISLNAL